MKSDRLLEEIKSRIDIVEFISDYVPLKKSGQNYKGLCPFHTEKTPSFMVSQSKQIFHCFGCGAGGDVVSFLMKHDNLPFGEAIRYIAKKAGIKIADFEFDKELAVKREKILQINEDALKFFIKNLSDSGAPRDYLARRGIEEESVRKFGIGYASERRDSLLSYLRKTGHADSLIQKAGLVVEGDGGFRDSFRRRVIFPIMNLKGDVIAFGGRVMDSSLPKYINSPETEVFKKGETLFAINLSKDEIRKKDYAVIVEGYLDTVMCHQYGFRNTVAPLGTALTSRHLQKLKVLTKKVVLVFDGDAAGVSAARRSLAILCENDFTAKVLLLPKGEDPDSFLRKNGAPSFQKMIANSQSLLEFLLSTSSGDRVDRAREALGVIATVKDVLRAEEMLGELAGRSGINESVLRGELERIRKKTAPQSVRGRNPLLPAAHKEELLLLSAIVSFPEKAGPVLSRLNVDAMRDATVRSLFYKIKMLAGNVSISALLEDAEDAERTLITKLSVEPGFDPELVDQNIDDCLQTIEYRIFEERKRLADSKKPDDAALHNSLLKEKRRFIKGANP